MLEGGHRCVKEFQSISFEAVVQSVTGGAALGVEQCCSCHSWQGSLESSGRYFFPNSSKLHIRSSLAFYMYLSSTYF